MDQQKVGRNELPDTEEIANLVSVLSPELCQKLDSVARDVALPVILVKENHNLPGRGVHSPIIHFIRSRLAPLPKEQRKLDARLFSLLRGNFK